MSASAENKSKAPRNKTIELTIEEATALEKRLIRVHKPVALADILDKTIFGDCLNVFDLLPDRFIDLAFLDPPYNLTKNFNSTSFKETDSDNYALWLDSWLGKLPRLLKPTASTYICGDWRSAAAIFNIAKKYFKIRNRITWEREKGRGARTNWKNCAEDIWFCTVSDKYTFNVDNVKIKRKVIAPYRDIERRPKDWMEDEKGQFRITYPSNLWTDISIPFWSMSENTCHPTQKPEKLLAKIILASSNTGDIVFDPFLGSGTTSVVARKLSRRFVGIEIDKYYCCLAEKRLEMAKGNRFIQGYVDGIFWERNSRASGLTKRFE
jgi:site-specific DNA-methyltransferase (adenine-specific)